MAGRRLAAAAFAEWPVRWTASTSFGSGDVEVSFVIGHRGESRLPHLLATIETLFAQEGCRSEVVVVEQEKKALLPGRLPEQVRWVHQPTPYDGMPYSRSWAFNRGAREARGRILVFHDNDVLAPASYAAELARLLALGYEAMRLQRFVFYLDREATTRVLEGRGAGFEQASFERVRQNCEGHTVAIARDAYFRLGGHDESFLGWGGEDNEFFDRCRLLKFHPWAYLPFLHLWHAPQPEKSRPLETERRLDAVLATPRERRAERLASRPFGLDAGPRLEGAA
jgi:hypothetical protein